MNKANPLPPGIGDTEGPNWPPMLDSIRVAEPPQEVESTGRMSTGAVVNTLHQMGVQLQMALDAYTRLPDEAPQTIGHTLQEIISACSNAKQKAEKLLASNK